jgi:TetR/AcrR family transcriptional repressor of mexJK operon
MVLQKRQGYIQKYYNLMEFNKLIGPELPDDLYEKFSRARAFELKIISSLIRRGVEKGEFQVENINLTAEVLVEALSGVHFNILSRHKNICPSQEQFKQIFIKEKFLAKIFLSGLSSN